MLNYTQLNDVNKIVRDIAKIDEEIKNECRNQDVIENDLEIHSDSEDEKADFIVEEKITKGNVCNNNSINIDHGHNKKELHREIRRKFTHKID